MRKDIRVKEKGGKDGKGGVEKGQGKEGMTGMDEKVKEGWQQGGGELVVSVRRW